jgi:protein-ribulosamine 3-kinase
MHTLPEGLAAALQPHLSAYLGRPVQVLGAHVVTGGSIHQARRVETDAGPFFVKYNLAENLPMLVRETEGLRALGACQALPVAEAIATGSDHQHAFLLQTWIAAGPQQPDFWAQFGVGMAALHGQVADRNGWHRDNYLGSVTQPNAWQADWNDLFALRLRHLAGLLRGGGLWDADLDRAVERLIAQLPSRIPPAPASLLHGDLWSGNFMTRADGQAVLIDPAVHYGHRESEIAFTQLFGGFDRRFYEAYEAAWPMEKGWQSRLPIYNLYPLMLHLHLFGRSYLQDIQQTLHFYA